MPRCCRSPCTRDRRYGRSERCPRDSHLPRADLGGRGEMLQAHEAQPRMSRLEDHMSSPEGRSQRRPGSVRRARLGSRGTRRSRWRRDAWRRCSTVTLRRGPRRDRYCCRCRRLLRSRRLGARSRHPAGHNSRSRRGCRFPCRWSLCRYRPIRL